MDLNLQDSELLYNFDFGIQIGNLISDSELVWCVNSKDDGLVVKNIADKHEASLPYHNFGIASNGKFSIINGKDFEYNKQRYLLLSIEKNKSSEKKFVMVIFKISTSKVICSFEVPNKVIKMEVLVKNKHFIDNTKNPSFFGNFEVSAICGCDGGAIQIFDITPTEELYSWDSNENMPINVYWYEKDSTDLIDYDEIKRIRDVACYQEKIFGLTLNRLAVEDRETFKYFMANDVATANIPYDCVKITCLKYEKQIDSIIVGFNFGCFQLWNMKTMSIESSSVFGENNKPVIGFSLLQPQNDPKKCIYLMVAHSTSICSTAKLSKKRNTSKESNDSSRKDESEFEIDNDDDDESDSSFILLYQLMFERTVNVYLSQNFYYILYESLNYCAIVFEHELTSKTLQCVKTNYSSEFDQLANKSEFFPFHSSSSNNIINEPNKQDTDTSQSKIISIQTLNIVNNRLQVDLACIIWALTDKTMSNSTNYYLSVFNLNNWYAQCMPSKMRPLYELTSEGKNRFRKNTYFNNYTISLNSEIESIKMISIIDSKIKAMKNQNLLSIGNSLKKLIDDTESNEQEIDDERELMDSNLNDDSYLSMHFDLIVLASFSLHKLSINPIEHQIHNYISKQEDLIHHPDKVFYLLSRFHLLDKYLYEDSNQPKFIPIFNYLFETSQIYPILKSLWKLNFENTSIISDCSLKAVLDWSWSKLRKIKNEVNSLYKLIAVQIHNVSNNIQDSSQDIEKEDLNEFLLRENNLLENLIQIYKHFLKLDTTSEGLVQLNKKLNIIESLKFYVEHLTLFHKYDLLLMASSKNFNSDTLAASDPQFINSKNYTKEILANLRSMSNRWIDRRKDQIEQKKLKSSSIQDVEKKYPFTYMIDCLVEECLLFANISNLFTNNHIITVNNENDDSNAQIVSYSNIYPPRNLNQLLEICLECNLSSKIKQVIILYTLCDLMHSETSPPIQNHILKLINSYCSTKFTLMSNKFDSVSSNALWSSSISNSDQDGSDNTSSLFDLVNGLYLIDSCLIEKAFKYLRAAELNYLEFYEKYFILYNSCNCKEYKIAVQYLWLFQKLNASSISSTTDLNNGASQKNADAQLINQLDSSNDSILFRYFSKSTNQLLDFVNKSNSLQTEQRMHFRLILTIYLANTLINEAYDLIKPQIKLMKSSLTSSSFNANSLKWSKELVIHFFNETERFKLMNKIIKLSSLDSDFLLMLFNYLEAKQDLNSIAIAIDLHVNSRNYKRAIDLYEKHAKQITNSEYSYLISVIDIAKEMSSNDNFSTSDDSTSYQKNKQFSLFSANELRDVANFEYKFCVPFKDLCKNSKRCTILLNEKDDSEYIDLLKLPELEFYNANITVSAASLQNANNSKMGQELTNLIHTPSNPLSKSSLQSSLKKRRASTPYNHHKTKIDDLDEESDELVQPATPTNIISANAIIRNDNKFISQTEYKTRTLTSSLKVSRNVSNSVSKSVKFKMVKYTREICDENKEYRDNEQNIEEEDDLPDTIITINNKNKSNDESECMKLYLEEDEDEKEKSFGRTNKSHNESERRQLFLEEEEEEKEKQIQEDENDLSNKDEESKPNSFNKETLEVKQLENDSLNKIECNQSNVVDTCDIKIDLPILNNFDNLRKSIISNIISRSPVRGEVLNDAQGECSMTSSKTVITINQEHANENIINEPKKEENNIEKELIEELEEAEAVNEINNQKSSLYDQMDMNADHIVTDKQEEETQQIESTEIRDANEEDEKNSPIIIKTTIETTVSISFCESKETNSNDLAKQIENEDVPMEEEDMIVDLDKIVDENQAEIINEDNIEKESTQITSQITPRSSQATAITLSSIQESDKKSFDSSNLKKSESILFELSEQNKADISHNSLNDSDITLNKSNEEKNQEDDELMQLNMSSVSQHCNNESPSKQNLSSQEDKLLKLPINEEPSQNQSKLSRTNSESSMFSHISSVSEHFEKMKKLEESKTEAVLKAKPPTRPRVNRHMDDNELSIKRAAAETSVESSKKVCGATSLRRRRSDLSSSSSSTSEASSAVVAKLRANIQKLPPTLGSNDQEARITRSKLKCLIEHPEKIQEETTPTPKKQPRQSARRKQTLELVEEKNEENEPAKMSISNLRKHNAAMEKLENELNRKDELPAVDDNKRKTPSARSTRSKVRSPSPTASSIVSESTAASIISNATSSASTKRRGRPPKAPTSSIASSTKNLTNELESLQDKTLKANELLEEPSQSQNTDITNSNLQTSPTNSVVSIASSVASSTTSNSRYTRKNRRTIQVDFNIQEAQEEAKKQSVLTRSNSGRSYGLRSKDKSLRSSSGENNKYEDAPASQTDAEEKVSTRSTRGTRSKTATKS